MNSKQIVGALLAVTLAGGTGFLAGCGDKDSTDATPGSSTSSSASPTTAAPVTPDAAKSPKTPADLVLVPGAAGPAKVGMSKVQADALGLFVYDDTERAEGCVVGLTWVAPFEGVLDVQAKDNGEIASIGVLKEGPKTASGLGVGSTLAEVLAAYPGAKAVEAGYGQTGVLIEDEATDGWIGFLVDADVKDVKDTDTVTFIELTEGEKPSVMRDGC